jgi:hypothetical protein
VISFRPVLLAALLLAACSARPPAPPPEPPETLPPLARAAVEEWEAWGRIVVEGWPDERPADTAATPARFDRLLDYWYALPGNAGVARRLMLRRAGLAGLAVAEPPEPESDAPESDAPTLAPQAPAPLALAPLPPEDIGLYASPAWSAAFIGFVARRAGIAEAELPSMPTHSRYLDRLLRQAVEEPEAAPWLPDAPEERAPRPGDLLCADRSLRPLSHWTQRLPERGRFRPMHCDVVIRHRPGVVEAIGGNVADMVVLRRFPADAEGRLLPVPPGRPPFLLLLAPRHPITAERAAELAALAELVPRFEPRPPPRRRVVAKRARRR